MAWNTKKLSENAYMVEDNETDPEKTLRVGSIVRPVDGRWYVKLLRADGGSVSGDFAKYETALAFVEGVEKMQAIKERTGAHHR